MNTTFMIGNGFDLNLGLKSSYSDFYKYYTAQNINDMIAKSINSNYTLWSDLELGLGEFTNIIKPNETDAFLDSKRNLELHLINYLKQEEKRITFNNVAARLFKDRVIGFSGYLTDNIKSKYNRILSSSCEPLNYRFISFNYTNILDQFIEIAQKDYNPFSTHIASNTRYNDTIESPIHVHGSLNKGLILGVNSEKQIINEELKADNYFTDYIIKPRLNDALGNNNNNRIKRIIDESSFICLYGLSLGKTDDYWWCYLTKWLTLSNDHTLVVFVHEPNLLNESAQETARLQNKYRTLILDKYNDINDKTKNSIRGNIIVIPNSEIFSGIGSTYSQENLVIV